MESVSRRILPAVLATAVAVLCIGPALAETVYVPGSTGQAGVSLGAQGAEGVRLHYEMGSYSRESVTVDGRVLEKIALPGVFLPNDAGAPDLPGMGRYLAIPRGSTAAVRILSARTQTLSGIDVAPAPVIPKETEDGPLHYEKDPAIYGRDAVYPDNPARLSMPAQIRGVDVVLLGITPFQYNPVTRELVVYTELDIRVDFRGGGGTFGEERLRNRYWEPMLESQILNYASLPPVDFSAPRGGRDGCEYIIITPDDPTFIAWADTLKNWRKLQGIRTEVFTTTEIGGTSSTAIESWLNNAYHNWNPAPAAFLILGDFPGSGLRDTGITSPIWNSYCVSDNMYADVDGDNLPDMVHARITARNAGELSIMIGKMMAYERAPYTDAAFYDHPVIAGGWQTERWFILCAEIIFGHQANVLGKHPVREYAIYSGVPGTIWSSNPNTPQVVDYFGPNGLGYIPATPQHLTDWGGNATRINNDLNAGAYFLLHRDHGFETGWGEPAYGNGSLSGLHNEKLPFVFSMNCLTGKYNWSGECFTEAFHRMSQGALGLIAASEISYSFVNDAFIWGLFDGMWPGFMPDYGPYPPQSHFASDQLPAFGMASGKYFLQASSWPYNPGDKTVTYHLFHHHGDAFLPMYSEVPRNLTVTHDEVLLIGTDVFRVQADLGSVIALTVNGEIIGVADATGLPQDIAIVPQSQPGTLRITITKANFYRYDRTVPILPPTGPYLVLDRYALGDPLGDGDGYADAGETLDCDVTLKNVGVEITTNVTATLTSLDPYVQVLTPEQAFPDIPAGGVGTNLEPYGLHVLGSVPDGHVMAFTLNSRGDEGSWTSGFSVTAQAPRLAAGEALLNDTAPLGDGDGVAEPGESFHLQVWVSNSGHSPTSALTGTLTCLHPDVVIHEAQGSCPSIPVGDRGLLSTFVVELRSTCPNPTTLPLHLNLSGESGFSGGADFTLDVGAWVDEAETDRGWTFGAPGDNASSGLWVRAEPVGTTYNGQQAQPEYDHTQDPAEICFVTGNGTPGGAAGEQDVDGGRTTLLSPVFHLDHATEATISYWRWYTNNLGNNPGQDWWDVDVTSDGLNWVHLEHTTDSGNSWNPYSFNLGDFISLTDQVQLRYVAADEAPGSLVEAAVDDFTLSAAFAPSTSVPTAGQPANWELVSLGPNPFRDTAAITYRLGVRTHARLALYDVAGRRVRTFVDGTLDAGEHTTQLEATDGAGRPLPSGIYFLRLQTPERLLVKQVTLLK